HIVDSFSLDHTAHSAHGYAACSTLYCSERTPFPLILPENWTLMDGCCIEIMLLVNKPRWRHLVPVICERGDDHLDRRDVPYGRPIGTSLSLKPKAVPSIVQCVNALAKHSINFCLFL